MNAQSWKTRFAPSPTGLLHVGNIRTALFNYLLAVNSHGVFLLRIEDTDATRGHDDYVRALQEDLHWLGLDWLEGPDRAGAAGPYLQSQRGEIYKKYFTELEKRGLAYPCFCSEHELKLARKTQLAAGRPPRYTGRCRGLKPAEIEKRRAAGTPSTLRFHVEDGRMVEFDDKVRGPQSFRTEDIGDFVVRRSDGTPAFFFSNAIDDAMMGITLVARGEDHLSNTPRQILLLQALRLPVPTYAHFALVVGGDGTPLSKRNGSRTVRELREHGFLPGAIHNCLARLGHTYEDNSLLDMEALAAGFDIGRLHRAPARFDEGQLRYWQNEAVRGAPFMQLWSWMGAEVETIVPPELRDSFIDTVRGNITFPVDARAWARILFSDDWAPANGARDMIDIAGPRFFDQAVSALEKSGTDFKTLGDCLTEAGSARGKSLFQPLRAALTGELHGPALAKLLPLMGVERARRRLQKWARTGEKSKQERGQ